jgi:hypothetical protein
MVSKGGDDDGNDSGGEGGRTPPPPPIHIDHDETFNNQPTDINSEIRPHRRSGTESR